MKKVSLLLIAMLFLQHMFAQQILYPESNPVMRSIANTNWFWGNRITLSSQAYQKQSIDAVVINRAIGLNLQNHLFYLEGITAGWRKHQFVTEESDFNFQMGIHQLFYQLKLEKSKLNIGVIQTDLADQYAINERIIGGKYQLKSNSWQYSLFAGCVTDYFSKYGDLGVSNRFFDLYEVYEPIGLDDQLFANNVVGSSFQYNWGERNQSCSGSKIPYIEESSLFSQINSRGNKVGALCYSEWGSNTSLPFIQVGAFASLLLPGKLRGNTLVLYQSEKNNKAWVYQFRLEKSMKIAQSELLIKTQFSKLIKMDGKAKLLNRFWHSSFGGRTVPYGLFNMFNIQLKQRRSHFGIEYIVENSNQKYKEINGKIKRKLSTRIHLNTKLGMTKHQKMLNASWLAQVGVQYFL
ncbi:hypothetical protein EMN47_03760 [Prolixibacteraceae bacterium JC049]|nr:hypothetical protein [Prolixibacteraceae bacterium JC049]